MITGLINDKSRTSMSMEHSVLMPVPMCVRNMEAHIHVHVVDGLLVKFLVSMATCTWAFSTIWPCFWSSGLLCVREKAPKALLLSSTIDISKNAHV